VVVQDDKHVNWIERKSVIHVEKEDKNLGKHAEQLDKHAEQICAKHGKQDGKKIKCEELKHAKHAKT
jgi:hypothetical protein